MANSTRVIIIGGGISGIKAAVELSKAGIHDYLILEAKNVLGGRLRTVQGKHLKYDLGASWFHETLNNALFDEENLISLQKGEKFGHYYDDAPLKVMNKNGVVPGNWKLDPINEEILKYLELSSHEDLEKDEALHDAVVRYLQERKHLLTDEQIECSLERMRSLELWHGIDALRTSTKYASIDNEGRDAFALNYDKVLQRHLDLLDWSKVKLNSPVKSITKMKKNSKQIVEVTTSDDVKYQADYTIITVPQSILQIKEKSDPNLIKFTPPLPLQITNALEKVHFGALGKVIFEFDEIFWPTDAERILVLANPPKGFVEAIRRGEEVPKRTYSTPPENYEFPILFLNLATTLKKPSLIALTQSPFTDYIESNPSKAWSFFKPVIQLLSSKKNIPSPSNQIISNWTEDPYQRGSYSACFPGDDPLSVIIALEKGFGNIRFAGEHTILEGTGCVHGAWMSGKREADYIIQSTKQN